MSGRAWARVGALLGAVASLAGNVLHGADHGPVAAAAGALWPVVLLVALEVLTRTSWPVGGRWTALRWLGVLPVALVAGAASWWHLRALLAANGEPGWLAALAPFALDGLMLVSAGALLVPAPAPAAQVPTLDVALLVQAPAPAAQAPAPAAQAPAPAAQVPTPAPAPAAQVPTPLHAVPDREALREEFERRGGIPAQEIAERLGITPQAAKSLRRRWSSAA